MGDHFVFLVDRLLTESTLEAAIRSGNMLKQAASATITDSDAEFSENCSSPSKLGECRICLDEDAVSRMEAPCSCSGSLKFAHRRCVQKWCNEKGNTTCEICHQQFKPGYVAPPPLFRYPMEFRRNWRIVRRNVDNQEIIAMVSTDPTFIDMDDSNYAIPSSSRRTVLCRAVATIFMALLILGHTLLVGDPAESYTFPLFMILMLGITGILLSVCIILKTMISFLAQRDQQASLSLYQPASAEEADLVNHPQQQHIIAIQ